MEEIIENDDNEILDSNEILDDDKILDDDETIDDYERFNECGFSEENSCYAYTDDFLLNYVNNKHPINISDVEIKEILSFLIMTEQSDLNKLTLKSTISKSIIGSKKLKKRKSKKKSKKNKKKSKRKRTKGKKSRKH